MDENGYMPLAERMRPQTLDEYAGQKGVVSTFKLFIEQKRLPSFILWGPPGVGKTTLAHIVAKAFSREVYSLSAVSCGVKDVRDVIEKAKQCSMAFSGAPILFIDEIHRFNKSQQDSLLAAVEKGTIVLIGATTENPSFEVISPLLSRANVYQLQPLSEDDMMELANRAISTDRFMKLKKFEIESTNALFRYSAGDGRKLLNIIETLFSLTNENTIIINDENVTKALQQNCIRYDKDGEEHYDVISAFIKSVRGSDPQAAIYYLARMLAAGEEPRFIARRLAILASEDIGLANPNAVLLANACFNIVHTIGMPEARITLSELTIYLASSPKSNSAYMAINNALNFVSQDKYRPVPLNIRNAPTSLMKEMGYGKGYKYSHDYEGHFVRQQFMPEGLEGHEFWIPQDNPTENSLKERLNRLWNDN